jgi:hypothetical protein
VVTHQCGGICDHVRRLEALDAPNPTRRSPQRTRKGRNLVGHAEYFGIGTDYAIWHITASFSNWRSMGGSASNMYVAFYSTVNGLPTVPAYVSWADHVLWSSSYRTSWSSWYVSGCRDPPLLQTRVVVDADRCELGDLFPAQPTAVSGPSVIWLGNTGLWLS